MPGKILARMILDGAYLIALACLLIGTAIAVSAAPAMAQPQPEAPSSIAPDTPDGLFGQAPISEAELAATTGREKSSWMNASSSNNAVVSGNQVGDNNMTGDVHVTDSAFQNVSGISMMNFNTGNNSSINAAMSVNLHITFAPVAP